MSSKADYFMNLAIAEAQKAFDMGEVPVGAVIADSKERIISVAHNMVEHGRNALLHAEILAINRACEKLSSKSLEDCSIYVTLEPCAMCAAAIAKVKIKSLYYGCSDTKSGAVENGVRFFTNASCHHRLDIYIGMEEKKASDLLKLFFKALR